MSKSASGITFKQQGRKEGSGRGAGGEGAMGGAGVGCGLRGVGWSKRGLSDRVSALVCSCWGLCRLKGVPYSKCNPAKHNICRCHRDVRAAAAHPEPGVGAPRPSPLEIQLLCGNKCSREQKVHNKHFGIMSYLFPSSTRFQPILHPHT